MKPLRLVALAFAVLTFSAFCVVAASAGGHGKGTATAGSSDCCGAKPATAAASTEGCSAGSEQCTAAQRAQCAQGAKSAKSASAHGAGACPMHGASAAAMHGCSAMSGKSTMAAGACAMHSAAGAKCTMASGGHGDCAVCSDEMACDDDVRGLNAHAQVVALRNGAMIVYTAETPESVRALQVALARHNEHILNALATNSEAGLCGGCKSFRGAMASGKFSRELVNVKTGAQVLLTSNDRAIVQRIHDMTVAQIARTKS